MSLFLRMIRDKFTTIPPQEEDCTGKTFVVTGANSGIGLETVRHLTELNAATVILACRSIDKGEQARKDVEESTGKQNVVQVWQLDLASYDSVREFASRVNKLERVDAFINNASLLSFKREMIEGHESMLTVNFISTALLSLLVLPALRLAAIRFNVTPRMVIVSSDAAFDCRLTTEVPNIFEAIDAETSVLDHYSKTKLLQTMFISRLSQGIDASGKGHIIANAVHPGLCGTQLFKHIDFPFSLFLSALVAVLGRTPEMGSRALLAGAFAGEDLHGKIMFNGEEHQFPKCMQGEMGDKLTGRVWDELMELLEGIEPGVRNNV
ncbi:hypothetical protein NXS19_012545 [Fusarium pseudograminearum]|uniref:Uncharacterized protein n=1 Tax=Fusarium pseudograminearum (strain CS3096) TaxID=1028729 RepID=K3VDV3_FUSPC|nr:hypothetical protein FPSE_07561 [Fusarium pseudograminearum CS3096]EKJ72267.1 hypothetical protein FPSE_07561 [Fusarium pseudograminearum CS3096]KAF0637498.1 hypothetical protein FPSE5266_07561 [Fusarium pseudograminearum]UZP44733.1 hypothetical protein NXS19_012545 [Fusarium pseudograminearum]